MTSKGKFTPKELVGKILIHFLTITDELGKKFSDLFQPPGAMFSALVEPAPSLSSQHVDPGLLISRPRKPGKWNFGPPWISTQNFQGIFLGVKKNINHDIRNDHVLQVSGQESTTSSEYPPS